MKIDIEKLGQLVEKSDAIFLSPEGEETLVQLLEIQKQVEDAISVAKEKLEEKALAISDDFKSIQGDKIKVFYRCFGSRYKLTPGYEQEVPAELKEVQEKVVLKPTAVEEWVEEHGALPLGVDEVDRKKTITFSLKNNVEEE